MKQAVSDNIIPNAEPFLESHLHVYIDMKSYAFRAEPEIVKVIDQYRGDITRSTLIRRAVVEYMHIHPEIKGKDLVAASASAKAAKDGLG